MTARAHEGAAPQDDDPIPPRDTLGLIPPIRPGAPGHDRDRSPYAARLADVVRRFGGTSDRRIILRGLLRFRAGLREIGISEGFQWLDGSFFEDVEATGGRSPNDIDVVTFSELGDEVLQQSRYAESPELFDHIAAKLNFSVDNYFVELGAPLARDDVRNIGYWYSLWAHRDEDQRWKGFVEVELGADGDADALALLDAFDAPGGAQ